VVGLVWLVGVALFVVGCVVSCEVELGVCSVWCVCWLCVVVVGENCVGFGLLVWLVEFPAVLTGVCCLVLHLCRGIPPVCIGLI